MFYIIFVSKYQILHIIKKKLLIVYLIKDHNVVMRYSSKINYLIINIILIC